MVGPRCINPNIAGTQSTVRFFRAIFDSMDGKMSNAAFWLALLDMEQDIDQRARLWNGYLGWKLPPRIKGESEPHSGRYQLVVRPPEGGWPELTDEEKELIEALAEQHGGHPDWASRGSYMDFSYRVFSEKLDLSGLIMVFANFDKARFESEVKFSKTTRFYAQSSFHEAIFEGFFHCHKTWFEADVRFTGSCFKRMGQVHRCRVHGRSLVHRRYIRGRSHLR